MTIREIVLLLIYLIAAAAWDILYKKVPNRLSIAGAAAGFICFCTEGEGGGYMLRLLLAIVLMIPFYILHAVGAGDVKTVGVLAGFIGIHSALICMILAFTITALYGLIVLIVSKTFRRQFCQFILHIILCIKTNNASLWKPDKKNGFTVPFCVCLLAGWLIWLAAAKGGKLLAL